MLQVSPNPNFTMAAAPKSEVSTVPAIVNQARVVKGLMNEASWQPGKTSYINEKAI